MKIRVKASREETEQVKRLSESVLSVMWVVMGISMRLYHTAYATCVSVNSQARL